MVGWYGAFHLVAFSDKVTLDSTRDVVLGGKLQDHLGGAAVFALALFIWILVGRIFQFGEYYVELFFYLLFCHCMNIACFPFWTTLFPHFDCGALCEAFVHHGHCASTIFDK